jgi:hypothetical protein
MDLGWFWFAAALSAAVVANGISFGNEDDDNIAPSQEQQGFAISPIPNASLNPAGKAPSRVGGSRFEARHSIGNTWGVRLPGIARQRFFTLERQAGGPRRRLRVLGLLVRLVVLVPLVHASPPDPLWLPGIYDGADSDDVALLAMGLEGTVDECALVAGPAPIASAVPLTPPRASFDSTLGNSQARAPPGS